MKRKSCTVAIIIVVILLLIGGCYGGYRWYKGSISENHYEGKTTEGDIKVSFKRYDKAEKFLKDIPKYVTLVDGEKSFKEEEKNGHGFILGQVKMDRYTYEKGAEYKMYLIQKNGSEKEIPLMFTTAFNDEADGNQMVKADFYFIEIDNSLYKNVRFEKDGEEIMGLELSVVK